MSEFTLFAQMKKGGIRISIKFENIYEYQRVDFYENFVYTFFKHAQNINHNIQLLTNFFIKFFNMK